MLLPDTQFLTSPSAGGSGVCLGLHNTYLFVCLVTRTEAPEGVGVPSRQT